MRVSNHNSQRNFDVFKLQKEYQDGRVEMEFITGERRITFQNGTIKDIVPAHFTITRFPNGDLKRTFPNKGQGLDYDCRVDYYYNEVDTWHVSFQDGSETFHFPGGQTETHIKDGPKEVLFPDGKNFSSFDFLQATSVIDK